MYRIHETCFRYVHKFVCVALTCVCVYDAMRCDVVCFMYRAVQHTQQMREGEREKEQQRRHTDILSLPILESLCISSLVYCILSNSVLYWDRVRIELNTPSCHARHPYIQFSIREHTQHLKLLQSQTHSHAHNALISPIPKRHLLRLSALGVCVWIVLLSFFLSFAVIASSMLLLLRCLFFSFICSFLSRFFYCTLFYCHMCMNGEHGIHIQHVCAWSIEFCAWVWFRMLHVVARCRLTCIGVCCVLVQVWHRYTYIN